MISGMKHLVVKNMPEDIGIGFKAHCVLKRTTMREEVIRLIKIELGITRTSGEREKTRPPGLSKLEELRTKP